MNFPAFSFPHLPGRNDPCWCGSGRKYKSCHCAFDQQIASLAAQGHIVPTHRMIKTPEQIEKIKESCKINIAVLDEIGKQIHEGMTTAGNRRHRVHHDARHGRHSRTAEL